MTNTKTGKKKLFRMTIKRKIMLSNIISTLNIRLDSVDEDGLARLFVLENNRITREQRKEELMELDTQLQELKLLHDVLEVVCLHEDDVFLPIHLKENRNWKNEWDIPLNIFNESIDKVISIMRWFQERGNPQNSREYDKKIEFLLLIKDFRNQESS